MWKKVSKDQIKSVPVGSKIHVCGVTTTLTGHYGEEDYGFDMEDKVSTVPLVTDSIFADTDWNTTPFIEVWEETDNEECLSLEDAIKAFEEEHNITIKDWEENRNIPETISLGQIMRVVDDDGDEELVMLVQVERFKYNLMCMVGGKRLLMELKIARQEGGVFSTKEIENNSGWKIIELLENPFRDGQSL